MLTKEELTQLKTSGEELPKVLTVYIERAAENWRIGRQFVKINRALVGAKGNALSIRVGADIGEAALVAEGASIKAAAEATPDYKSGTVTVTPTKFAFYGHVTKESILAGDRDYIDDLIDRMGKKMADEEDRRIIYEAVARTAFSALHATGGVIAAGTWIRFVNDAGPINYAKIVDLPTVTGSVTGAFVLSAIDAYDGWYKLTVNTANENLTAAGFYSARTYFRDAATMATLAFADVAGALGTLVALKGKPDVIVINAAQYPDLLSDTRFRNTDARGSQAIWLGEIGRVLGMRVLVSTIVPEGCAFLLSSKRAETLVMKEDLETTTDYDYDLQETGIWTSEIASAKVTHDEEICVLLNIGALAADH